MQTNKLFIFYLALILLMLISCDNKNNPTIPQDKPFPSGVPDWNSSEYDWIDSSFIHWWEYPKSPKYAISILDCSPDGNNLILQDLSFSKVYSFDVNSWKFKFLIEGNNAQAEWSTSGMLIGFGFASYNNNEKYCIFNWEKRSFYFIPPPDSFNDISGTFKWWDDDSTFLTSFMKAGDKRSHIYSVEIAPPYKIQIREDLNYDFEQYNELRYSISDDTINKFHSFLEIKNNKNVTQSKNVINGVTFPQSEIKISPNGKYLAFIGSADLTNTKRYDLFMQNGMGGNLVILKLDELSPGNLIYRFFPDYTNHYHGKFYSQYINIGAWSSDSKYFYHTFYQPDSTIQIVKRNIFSGNIEFLTNLKKSP